MRWTRGGWENPERFPSKHVTMLKPSGAEGKVSLCGSGGAAHSAQREARTVPAQSKQRPRSTWKNHTCARACRSVPHLDPRPRAHSGPNGRALLVPEPRRGAREGESARLCVVTPHGGALPGQRTQNCHRLPLTHGLSLAPNHHESSTYRGHPVCQAPGRSYSTNSSSTTAAT